MKNGEREQDDTRRRMFREGRSHPRSIQVIALQRPWLALERIDRVNIRLGVWYRAEIRAVDGVLRDIIDESDVTDLRMVRWGC